MTVSLKDDLLRGANAISEFTGDSLRRTYYLLETGVMPGFKVGEVWCMRRSKYLQFIERLEYEAGHAAHLTSKVDRGHDMSGRCIAE